MITDGWPRGFDGIHFYVGAQCEPAAAGALLAQPESHVIRSPRVTHSPALIIPGALDEYQGEAS